MNKKVNYILYLVASTLFSVLLILGLFFGMTALFAATLGRIVSQTVSSIFLLFSMFASLGLSLLIQNFIVRKLSERIDLEKYFEPPVVKHFFAKRRPNVQDSRSMGKDSDDSSADS